MIEAGSPWAIFYCSYFIRCEYKLPDISLFSETCDYIHFSPRNSGLTFNRYSLLGFLLVTNLLHFFSPLSLPNLTDVMVRRTTPGRTQTIFPELPVCFDKEVTPNYAEFGERHNVWFDKSGLDFPTLLLFQLPLLQSECILESSRTTKGQKTFLFIVIRFMTFHLILDSSGIIPFS